VVVADPMVVVVSNWIARLVVVTATEVVDSTDTVVVGVDVEVGVELPVGSRCGRDPLHAPAARPIATITGVSLAANIRGLYGPCFSIQPRAGSLGGMGRHENDRHRDVEVVRVEAGDESPGLHRFSGVTEEPVECVSRCREIGADEG